MPTVKLVVEYDGALFSGWQQQPGQKTVQSSLTSALHTFLREPVHPVIASGRTDAGVHARGQVVSFQCRRTPDLDRLRLGVSAILRDEVAILSAELVEDSFHACGKAKNKQYSYIVLNRSSPPVLERGRVWYVHRQLDREAMSAAARTLEGTHDFTSFRAAGCGAPHAVRTIFSSSIEWLPDRCIYRVQGDGFVYNMVRIIVGTLVDIGTHRLRPGSMSEILTACERSRAGQTAPPQGLYLDWVEYS